MASWRQAAVVGGLLWGAVAAAADDGPPWETVATGAITVKARPRANSSIQEIWAEGYIEAPLFDVQATILDADHYVRYMPYMKEARILPLREADGSRYVYSRLSLPLISDRDYVVRARTDAVVGPDGKGAFTDTWVSAPDKLPRRPGAVRVIIDEGSWHIVPAGNGSRCYAVYKFAVDPGGSIPSFVADRANKSGVTDTFRAVEQEAQRRWAERRARVDAGALGRPDGGAAP